MFYDDGTELIHYGIKYRSGRYPYGSGENPYQHDGRRHVFGSDKHPFETGEDFLKEINRLKASGKSAKDISLYFGLSLSNFKKEQSIARAEVRRNEYNKVKELTDQGHTPTEIGRMLGKNESSIRTLLQNDKAQTRMELAEETASVLKEIVNNSKDGMVDVGPGVEKDLGINRNKFEEALYICEMDGYGVYGGRFEQTSNPRQKTTTTVLCTPGTEHREIFDKTKTIEPVSKDYYSHDGGTTFEKIQPPVSIDSKRIKVVYRDQGGLEKDGVIELRRGAEDLDLDGSNYAQVRIAVDGTHYLKGMAVYNDNMPDGVDIIFNTNKPEGTPLTSSGGESVFKKMKTDDPTNPFGATIKKPSAGGQHYYIDENGNKKLSAINKVKDEGDWDSYTDSLAAQFLVKQPLKLINQQLNLSYNRYLEDYDNIQELTNPTVKKNRLMEFADTVDGAAVHLKAAALPRQNWQVILPAPSMPDNEIYALNYQNGEKVALVRYPHEGTFQIPILTVNNNHKETKKTYGQLKDAVAFNSSVAERLSGADFDGDTVLVIPVGPKSNIKSTKPLKGLENFDAKVEYASKYDENTGNYISFDTGKPIKLMNNTQNEMGRISNLITDMTLKDATEDELARAVRYSQTVIDAEKHHLDYKKSYSDNNIAELKEKYQGRYTKTGKYSEGASTLISASKSQVQVPERQGSPRINYDPKTGEANKPRTYTDNKGNTKVDKPPKDTPLGGIYYISTDRTYLQVFDPNEKKWVSAYRDPKTDAVYYKSGTTTDSNGNTKNVYKKAPSDYKVKETKATQKSKALAELRDAYDLSSGTIQENAYADYSNKLKALANKARIEALSTKDIDYNKEANYIYKNEVNHLIAQLNDVERNKPKERLANRIANSEAEAIRAQNPEMSNGEYKKLKQQKLDAARADVGAKKPTIIISDKEWEAIQAGAVNKTTLNKILDNTDSTLINKLAMPRDTVRLTTSQVNRIKAMYDAGRSAADIAKLFGVSTSTIYGYVKGE